LKYIPVVDDHENMNLLFTVKLQDLKDNFEMNFGELTSATSYIDIRAKAPSDIVFKRRETVPQELLEQSPE